MGQTGFGQSCNNGDYLQMRQYMAVLLTMLRGSVYTIKLLGI